MRIRAISLSLLALSTGAQELHAAQSDSPASTNVGPADTEIETVIVTTGRLVTNPNLEQSSPVGVIGADEIQLKQVNSAEQFLREVPGVVGNVGSNTGNGQRGAAFVNLRGLGVNRNIAMLNSARLTPVGLDGQADLNNIPLALIERVDVLTGGASTTYGADAVSGVINFITRKDFSGAQFDVSDSRTERGDGDHFRVDATFGANLDDDRGNATLSIGYQNADPVYQGERPFGEYALSYLNGQPLLSGTTVPTRFSLGASSYQIDPQTGGFPATTSFTGFNFNEQDLYQVPYERFNLFGQAHYEVADGIELYGEGMFVRNQISQLNAPGGTFGQSFEISYSNPFLPALARSQFCAANGLSVADCDAAAATTDPFDPAYRTFRTSVNRRFVESGLREKEFKTTMFQFRAGVRGSITEHINFDLFGTYGESDQQTRSTGQGLYSRFVNALDAVSTTECRVGGNCVPINLFGAAGSITPEMSDYFNTATTVGTLTSLSTLRGVISADLGISSPWASNQLSGAVGGEYRDYQAANRSDLASQTPGEVLGAAAVIDSTGSYNVTEGFVELIAPIIEDKPFIKSLTAELGGRVSEYSTAGTNNTWKAGGTWAPVDSLRFRGTFQHGARAPSVGELFAPRTGALANLATDPCAGVAPTLNANLRAVCLAQGAPVASIGVIPQPPSGLVNVVAGGNPELKVETSDSYTIGVVFQPEFLPNLAITLDYYNIEVTDAISAPTTADAILACFGADPLNPSAAAATNPACTAVRRNVLTGELTGSFSEVGGFPLPLANLGRLLTDGIDFSVDYRHELSFGELSFALDGNWTNRAVSQLTPTSDSHDCVSRYGNNCLSIQPETSWNQRTTLTVGRYDVSLLWRHIGGSKVEEGTTIYAPYAKIDAQDYFDLTTRVELIDQLSLTLTITNVLDEDPPIVGSGLGLGFNSGNTYPSTYDVLGRRYTIGARYKF
ncbi:TonB-dependent receptor domain-containing protein [Peristeroidobacter agariperforans]|uniref:TonB-dependent receptor domain-containing protein n=1 Tax=Peristeroidobacter agariperforans TaxID=268404 RepID=UPI00101B8E53|nr:TonB-dependent receptor [Peristeroidobacter agariperforans]